MKHLIYLISVVSLFVSCGGENVKLSSTTKPIDSVSYAIGVYEAYSAISQIQNTPNLGELDYDYLLSGFKSILMDKDSIKMLNDSVKKDMEWASKVINGYLTKKMQEAVAKVKKEEAVFLEANAKNDSVKVLSSGLQYKVIAEGDGISPEVADTVGVIYTGTLSDGTIFDSSQGSVRKMPLMRMIKGWQEGLPLMKTGAKYKFYIPSDLAYGDAGRFGGKSLIFDIELVSVGKGAPKEQKK
jgi:FKBP-type peptidyl-prolyl cis-trans isomerase